MSPYFARHFGIFLLIVGNCPLAGYVLFSADVEEWIRQWPIVVGIILRAICVLYASLSLLVLLIAILCFLESEFTNNGKTSWKNHRNWLKIKLGMTESEVIQILGPPQTRTLWSETEERFEYKLHPWDYSKGGIVSFPIDPNQPNPERKVSWLFPENKEHFKMQFGSSLRGIIRRDSSFRGECSSMFVVFSFLGLVVLGMTSLISIPPASYYSLGLYTPVIAILLGHFYEKNIQGGWRYDGCLLFPVYFLIFGSWLGRLVTLIRSA